MLVVLLDGEGILEVCFLNNLLALFGAEHLVPEPALVHGVRSLEVLLVELLLEVRLFDFSCVVVKASCWIPSLFGLGAAVGKRRSRSLQR